MVYTFTLRDDAVWVNNKGEEMAPVTAEDFVFSWERMVDPSSYLGLWQSSGIGGQNYTAYSNEEYDKLFNETINMTDVDARFTNFAKLEKMIVDDNVLIPFYQEQENRVISERYNVPSHTFSLISHKYVTINE